MVKPIEYRSEEFPHGLRCHLCDTVIEDQYVEVVVAVLIDHAGEEHPTEKLMCVRCGEKVVNLDV